MSVTHAQCAPSGGWVSKLPRRPGRTRTSPRCWRVWCNYQRWPQCWAQSPARTCISFQHWIIHPRLATTAPPHLELRRFVTQVRARTGEHILRSLCTIERESGPVTAVSVIAADCSNILCVRRTETNVKVRVTSRSENIFQIIGDTSASVDRSEH